VLLFVSVYPPLTQSFIAPRSNRVRFPPAVTVGHPTVSHHFHLAKMWNAIGSLASFRKFIEQEVRTLAAATASGR